LKKTGIKTNTFREKSCFNRINKINIYELYHRNSELNSVSLYKFSEGIEKAISDDGFLEAICEEKKLYNDCSTINMPDPNPNLTELNLFDVLYKRRSVRKFDKSKPVNLEELSTILFYSGGIMGKYEPFQNKPKCNLFAFPSAGGLVPTDIYFFVTNVEGLDSGIYYYNPYEHNLKIIDKGFSPQDYRKITGSYNLAVNSSFVVYILGDMELTGYKYGDRGYRFMNLEAGHLAQNLYLTSTAIGAGAVASGGFLDKEILEMLKLRDVGIFVLYEIIIGKPDLRVDYRFL